MAAITKTELEEKVNSLELKLSESENLIDSLKRACDEKDTTIKNLSIAYSRKTRSLHEAVNTFHRFIALEFKEDM